MLYTQRTGKYMKAHKAIQHIDTSEVIRRALIDKLCCLLAELAWKLNQRCGGTTTKHKNDTIFARNSTLASQSKSESWPISHRQSQENSKSIEQRPSKVAEPIRFEFNRIGS
jgi:hypothetical protein